MKNIIKMPIFVFLNKYREIILLLILFVGSFFLRIFDMGNKYTFGWDQIDNAWAAQDILINHNFPLVGMVAKGNTGFYIGPLYYYYASLFYWLTDLNPIASQHIALVGSIFTFFVIYFIVKKLFGSKVALIACLINSISFSGYTFDTIQWPVSFLPGVSLLIFYFLYKLLKGEEKYILITLFLVGLAFHLHFTAIFFPIIIALCFPFFPKTKKMLFYFLLSIPIFFIWFIPNIIYQLENSSQLGNISSYLASYYHGFHIRRFIQIMGDGLIQFDPFISFGLLKPIKILIIPIFLFIFLRKNISKEKLILSFLILIYFLIPWIAFSTYKGEISDYYFSVNRFIALFVLSYLLAKLFSFKNLIMKSIIVGFIAYYSYFNLNIIFKYSDENSLQKKFENVIPFVESNKKIEFQEGIAESYIYYYLMRKKGVLVY